jgi:hypothetical protein
MEGDQISAERSRTVSPLSKRGPILCIALVVLALAPAFWIRSDHNASLIFVIKYLSIPIMTIGIGLGLFFKKQYQASLKNKSSYWPSLFIFPIVAVGLSLPLCEVVNAIIPPQRHFVLNGIVTVKYISGSGIGRSTRSYIVGVSDNDSLTKFEVSEADFDLASIGSRFTQERIMGPLGFSYVWK